MTLRTHYDVVVAGGGIAGISAAAAAGRMGASVLLVERYGFVGGMSTAGMVSPFMKHSVNGRPLVRGVFADIEAGMRSRGGMIDNGFLAAAFRSTAFALLRDAGCTVLLSAVIDGVNRKDDLIESLSINAAGREITVGCSTVIDASGDAQVLHLGGFPWVKGDERTGLLQAMTLFFRMGGIDIRTTMEYARAHKSDFFDWMEYECTPGRIVSVAGFFSNVKKAIEEGRLPSELSYIFFTTLPETGEASFNTSNILGLDGSSSHDLTRAELIGREQVHRVVTLLRNEIPGFERALLLETAVQTGIRETRRAVGDYVVTGDDIRNGRKFADAIAAGSYGIDIHGQHGEENRMEHLVEGRWYEVPLRALIVKSAENLLAAGRCISSTREGHSALRIQPTSSATGEACGVLAALAALHRRPVRAIDSSEVRTRVQHNLMETIQHNGG